MIYDHNIGDYAWYEVGQQRYYSKIQALFAAQASKQAIKYNFNDEVFSRHRWDIEPVETLETLYAQRAEQIRNSYDYVVLHFSGGTDSGNIMETFIRNKIHLDEVCIRGSISQTTQKNKGVLDATDQYSECLSQSLPLATWIKDHHMPHLRITVVDTVKLIIQYFENNPDWIEREVDDFSPSNYVIRNLDMLSPHYKQMAESGKRVAHIFGVGKPRICKNKHYYYTIFSDRGGGGGGTNWVCLKDHIDSRPQYVECFYWGINAIKLQIKQLHVLKNYIKKYPQTEAQLLADQSREWENLVASIIYRRTLPLLTEHKKNPNSLILPSRDLWFAKDDHADSFQNWKKGVEYLRILIDSAWYNDNSWNSGMKSLHSKPHYLGT
jgi:hypothetical protein